MTPSLSEVSSFAAEKIRGTLEERYEAGLFSREIWRQMGSLGLLGMTVPGQYGGAGGSALELAGALREFTRAGCDMGTTVSWITHLALCVKSIEVLGTEQQKEQYLPRLVSGEWVGATAVSEPKTGAHPAGILTTATRTASGFTLSGSKMYVTDGPVADLLVVVAMTDEDESGHKELTSFLVETAAPGFEAKRMDMNFLATSPHGELTFDGIELGPDSVLGSPGDGHSSFSRSAFARERSLVVAAFCGLFDAAAKAAADLLIAREGAFDLKGQEAYTWVHHMSALEAYRRLSETLVDDALTDIERWRGSIDLLIYLGISYARWASWIERFASERKLGSSALLNIMLADMKLVMVGEGLLLKQGIKRYIT